MRRIRQAFISLVGEPSSKSARRFVGNVALTVPASVVAGAKKLRACQSNLLFTKCSVLHTRDVKSYKTYILWRFLLVPVNLKETKKSNVFGFYPVISSCCFRAMHRISLESLESRISLPLSSLPSQSVVFQFAHILLLSIPSNLRSIAQSFLRNWAPEIEGIEGEIRPRRANHSIGSKLQSLFVVPQCQRKRRDC